MGNYEVNLEGMKINKNFLYNSIIEMKLDRITKRLNDVSSKLTKDGSHAVVVDKLGKEYRLNSIYSPQKEVKRWIDQYDFNVLENVITMFGLGNGCFAREIMNRMDATNKLIIYEPSAEIFIHVLHNYDILDILTDERVIIAVDDINKFEFHSSLRSFYSITNLQTLIKCIHPVYDELFPEEHLYFWTIIKDACKFARININTQSSFGERYITNICHNLKHLKNSYTIYDLKDKIRTDLPAIVVAAGPSVETNLDELKKAKGRAIIFAVDRILDYLLDNGIVPDFVTTVDAMKPLQYFTKRKDINIPLICFMHSNYEIMDQHIGEKVIVNSTNYLSHLYDKQGKACPSLIPSASVATVASTTCVELGFKTIILVGQDLAYSGSTTHAGGVEETHSGDDELFVEDVHGNMIKTRYDWKEFIGWYEDLIFVCPNVKFIDAKQHGAKIKGSEVLKLEEAMNIYGSSIYNGEIVKDKVNLTFDKNEMLEVKEILTSDFKALDKIDENAKRAITICNRLIKDVNNKVDKVIYDYLTTELKLINNEILEQPIYWMIDNYISSNDEDILWDIYVFSDDAISNQLKTYEKSIRMFEIIHNAVEFIKPRLEEGLENLI